MAFRRTAKALVEKAGIEFDEWMDSIRSQHEGVASSDHVHRVAKNVLRKCDPKRYLLSHATIVASADVSSPRDVKTGRFMNRGVQCERRWTDFRVKPDCHEFINNNGDAWSRPLLLATYRTFIGAPNYLEHVQLPELSKGFIVDAIARDLGKTCYVDILVATDRKHKMLVSDILTGKMSGLSMGCISLFTICTKCGNVASDDSQLCPCVAFDSKGSKYLDEDGVQHPVSELIGHVSVPNSNQFIEASWVRNPAFRGAVRRNILNPADESTVASMIEQASVVFDLRRDVMDFDLSGVKRAASVRTAQDDPPEDPSGDDKPPAEDPDKPSGDPPGGSGDDALAEEPESAARPPGDPLDSLLEKAQQLLVEKLVEDLSRKMAPKPEDVGTASPSLSDAMSGNDNIIRSSEDFSRRARRVFNGHPALVKWAGWAYSVVHSGGRRAIRRAGMTSQELIVLSWIEDVVQGRSYDPALYKLSMRTGPTISYPSEASYLAACRIAAGRGLSDQEKSFLSWKGKIGSLSSTF